MNMLALDSNCSSDCFFMVAYTSVWPDSEQWTGFTDRQHSLPLIIFNEGGIKAAINMLSSHNMWLSLTTELCSDVGRGVQAEQLLPVAGNDPSLAVRHCPLTGDGQGGALYLEPVNSIGVSDRAVLRILDWS